MRGATLPPTPSDAMQRKTVSREASVTPGKSPARSPHPKAWDASFVKTPAPTLDEAASFRASSSRDRAERMSREKHAHMEARAELLSLIAEAAADADVLGEAFSGKEGDVPGPGASVRVALPPPRLAMREIKERRDRERAAEADRARRAEALRNLRRQQRETAAARRESGRGIGSAPKPAAEKAASLRARGAFGEKENETEPRRSLDTRDEAPGTPPRATAAEQEEAARRAEVQAFIAESKARWRVKLAQEKTAARLREQKRLEILKKERAAAREAAREHAAARETAIDEKPSEGRPGWDTTPAEETANAPASAPPTPVRVVGASASANASAAAVRARETRAATGEALGRLGVSEHASRVGISSSSSAVSASSRSHGEKPAGMRETPGSLPSKARKARASARASADLKKRFRMEDEARTRRAREAASGSSLGGSAFVDTAIGARVAEARRLRGEEARERLRAEVEARLEAAKRAARDAAERARAEAETAAPTRGSAASRAAAASAAASAVVRRSSDGQTDRSRRSGDTRVRESSEVARAVSRSGLEAAPSGTASSPAKSALKKTTPTKSPKSPTRDDASARHISFAATVQENDGVEKPMDVPVGVPEPRGVSEPREVPDAEGASEGAARLSAEADELRSRPRLLERMRGPPSTRTALPGDEHVPRAEDWLGMGQGGGAGRIARRLAKRRAPRDPHAPPLEPPDSREAAAALEAKAFAKRGSLKAFTARSADDAFGSDDNDERVHKSARAAEPPSVSRYPREPRGVLSTYARRRFQSLLPVAPAEAEETPPEETPGTESDRAARATLAESSAQTDFEDVVAAVRPTSPDASFPRAHSSAAA